jgi:hypothetical protein
MFRTGSTEQLTIEVDDRGTSKSSTPMPIPTASMSPLQLPLPAGLFTASPHTKITYRHTDRSGTSDEMTFESNSPVLTSFKLDGQHHPKITISPAPSPKTGKQSSPPAYSGHNIPFPTPLSNSSPEAGTPTNREDEFEHFDFSPTPENQGSEVGMDDADLKDVPFEGLAMQQAFTQTLSESPKLGSGNSLRDADDDWELLPTPAAPQFTATDEPIINALEAADIEAEDDEDEIDEETLALRQAALNEQGAFVIIDFNKDSDTTDYSLNGGTQTSHTVLHWKIKMAGEYAGPKIKKIGLYAASAIPPVALAINAFCAFPHFKTAELTLEKIKDLSPAMLTLCIMNATSSYSINTILNVPSIRNAFAMFYDRVILHFGKHPVQNTAILTLSAGAGVAMGGVGYASLLPLGVGFASANFATNAFIFFVTRFYGLVNALHRFEKTLSHNYESNPLKGRAFDDILSHLTNECAHDLNQFLKRKHPHLNELAVTQLLIELDRIVKNDPAVVKDKTWAEKFGMIFDLVTATGLGLAVLPVFAQKFLDGLDKLITMISGKDSTVINELGLQYKALLSVFSIATSILYTGQALLLRQTLLNAYDNVTDPHQSTSNQIAKGVALTALIAGNGLACTSLYNLTETALNEPNYVGAAITPTGTYEALANAILGATGAFAVNAKISISEALPAPKTSIHPLFRRTDSSANLPSLARQSAMEPDLDAIAEGDEEDSDLDDTAIINAARASKLKTKPAAMADHKELDAAIKWLAKNTLSFKSLGKIHANHLTLFGAPPSSPATVNNLHEPLLATNNTPTNRK